MPSFRLKSTHRPGVGSGKLVVAGMVIVAVILAGITLWHHWSQGQASIAYWGADNGENIRYAPLVKLEIDGETHDISQARGLVHFRQALIEDASFVMLKPLADANPQWTHEVTFAWPEREKSTVVTFDLTKGLVGLKGEKQILVAQPEPTASGLREFFADVISSDASR